MRLQINDDYKTRWTRMAIFIAMLFLANLGFTIGWVALHTILVKRIGIEYLPYSYIGLSLSGIATTFFYLLYADRKKRHHLLMASLVILSALLILSRFFVSNHFEGESGLTSDLVIFAILIIFAEAGCGVSLNMQIWTMIGDIFTPHEGKTFYPIFGASTLLSGIAGGVLVPIIIEYVGVGNLLLIWAFILILMIPLALTYPKIQRHTPLYFVKPEENVSSVINNLKDGLNHAMESRVFRLIFGVALSFCILNAWQDFQYTQIMNHHFPSEVELGKFYGYYWIAFNATALLLQLLASGRIIRRIGVLKSLTILPLVLLINFILLSFHYGFLEGLWMRFSWDTVGMTIQGTAYQLAFSAVPVDYRGRIRGLIEGVVNPTGTAIAGFLLLSIQFFIGSSPQSLWDHAHIFTILGIFFAVIWIFWVYWNKSDYFKSIHQNIRSEAIQTQLDGIESLEEKDEKICLGILLEILKQKKEDDKQIKSKALQVLGRLGNPKMIPAILPFLKSPSASLRLEAIRSISSFNSVINYPFVYEYLRDRLSQLFVSDPNNLVRIESGKFLIKHNSQQNMLKFVENVFNGSPQEKILIIRILSHISLSFYEVILLRLTQDEDLAVREEALVNLWNENECRGYVEACLEDLYSMPDTESKGVAITASIRIGSPYNLVSRLNEINGGELHLSCLKSILFLSSIDEKNEEWEEHLDHIFAILSNKAYSYEDRIKFIRIFSIINESISNAIIRRLISIPIDRLSVIIQGMDQFRSNIFAYEKEALK